MIEIIIVFLLYHVFELMHEGGHMLAARLFRLKIEKFGYTLFPVPHFFVSVLNVPDNYIKYIFLFSGLLTSLILFLSLWMCNLLQIQYIYYAVAILITLDTNPFYSDFTNIEVFGNQYKFSYLWYLHFIVWGLIIYGFLIRIKW